jgi:hypothetical protein
MQRPKKCGMRESLPSFGAAVTYRAGHCEGASVLLHDRTVKEQSTAQSHAGLIYDSWEKMGEKGAGRGRFY